MNSKDRADLFEAAANGDVEFIKKNITDAKTAKDERGWTALHIAARFNRYEVAKILKENDADLTLKNAEGKTAGEVAKSWENKEIADLLAINTKPTLNTDTPLFPDNYSAVFAGSKLNRYGWKRSKPEFLSLIARSPKAKYILLNASKALYNKSHNLHYLLYTQVSQFVDQVYSAKDLACVNKDIHLVFLGIDESNGKGVEGEPYWALDVTPGGEYKNKLEEFVQELESDGSFEFLPTLPRAFTLDKPSTAIISQSAALIDWNSRNKYCSACGKSTVSKEAGYKRICEGESECISHTSVQNFCYPRTDAVVISCIVHPDGDKILLGRQKRWPNKMFSCISGFVDPAETVEEAVRREAFEEAGVLVNRVVYHSSQPWPFPNSLMLGFFAEAESTEINLTDEELESARWFSRSEVEAALKGEKDATFSMAPKGSLANTLVTSWIYDKKWQQAAKI